MTDELFSRLVELSRAPVLLVACDFDGTLAPIANEPGKAIPIRESIVALQALAEMPHTHVAIVSGRGLHDLALLSGITEKIHLVGSHGSEFDPDFVNRLTQAQLDLRERLQSFARQVAHAHAGLFVEEKPAGAALHYRNADESTAAIAINAVTSGPATWPQVTCRHDKMVLDLSILPNHKGDAIETIRRRIGARATIFVGDDRSDEAAFAALGGPDVAIKVGSEVSCAQFRVKEPLEVAKLLATLADLRVAWNTADGAVPIEQHSLLSDQRTVALITPDARIVWSCQPRIDSPAIFAEIIGGPTAGYFSIGAEDRARPLRQTYIDDTFVIRTEWPTFSVLDYLDCSAGRPYQRAGRTDLIRVIEGKGRVVIKFAPRVDFGRQATTLKQISNAIIVDGSTDPIVLRSPGVEWQIEEEGTHHRAIAIFELAELPLVLELRHGLSNPNEYNTPEPKRREQTLRFWGVWSEQLRVPPVYPGLVRRSALVLKALSYGPTGAIAAAATTGLPERIGGVRNWDYRYCWLRDAALSATTLVRLGNIGLGMKFLDWVLGILDRDERAESLRPVYTVTGSHLGAEAEIAELRGYRSSRPVRVGNAAAQQLQLDVFGPIVDLIATLAANGSALSSEHWRLVEAMVNAVGRRWQEPDHGIWEVRRAKQHYVHSKVMCWVAVDRALAIAESFSGERPAEWISLRDQIGADILGRGWNPDLASFTSNYDEPTLDAAVLHVGLSGLLPPGDQRFRSTVDAVARELRRGSTVYRYRFDDGLSGGEGGFHLCTCWLMMAYAIMGRIDEATQLLDEFVRSFGPTGLAAEEWDPQTNESLGNFPQAYTHLGLCDVAVLLANLGVRRE